MYYYCKAHLVVNVVFTLMLCIVQLRYQSLSRPGLENIASNRLNEDGNDTTAGNLRYALFTASTTVLRPIYTIPEY